MLNLTIKKEVQKKKEKNGIQKNLNGKSLEFFLWNLGKNKMDFIGPYL